MEQKEILRIERIPLKQETITILNEGTMKDLVVKPISSIVEVGNNSKKWLEARGDNIHFDYKISRGNKREWFEVSINGTPAGIVPVYVDIETNARYVVIRYYTVEDNSETWLLSDMLKHEEDHIYSGDKDKLLKKLKSIKLEYMEAGYSNADNVDSLLAYYLVKKHNARESKRAVVTLLLQALEYAGSKERFKEILNEYIN